MREAPPLGPGFAAGVSVGRAPADAVGYPDPLRPIFQPGAQTPPGRVGEEHQAPIPAADLGELGAAASAAAVDALAARQALATAAQRLEALRERLTAAEQHGPRSIARRLRLLVPAAEAKVTRRSTDQAELEAEAEDARRRYEAAKALDLADLVPAVEAFNARLHALAARVESGMHRIREESGFVSHYTQALGGVLTTPEVDALRAVARVELLQLRDEAGNLRLRLPLHRRPPQLDEAVLTRLSWELRAR